MLRPYRELLALPGTRMFSLAGFVARLPIAMMSLGIVLLVAAATGSYGIAGTLAGAYALVSASTGPLIARLVDRLGQRRVLVPAVGAHVAFLALFVLAVSAGAPVWSWFLAVAATGAASPPIGSMIRTRWGHVLGAGPRLQTAYSFESVVDELIFIVGPLLVTVLATQVDRRAGLLGALVLVGAGTAVLVAQRASEPPAVPRSGHAHRSVLRAAGMVHLMVAMVFIGGVFAGVEISTVAYADERRHPALAGPLLACYALGSMLAGLLYGGVHWQISLPTRFLLGTAVMTATVAVLPFVGELALAAPVLFLAGIGIAPTLIAGLTLVEQMVPGGRVTEGLTWATTGITIGISGGSSIAGRLVDEVGAQRAFTVAVVSGAAAVMTCIAGYSQLAATGRARLPVAPDGGA